VCEENLIFRLFYLRLIETSKKHGAGKEYIQGQLNEARLQLYARKLYSKE
jgi:hypothetical protein